MAERGPEWTAGYDVGYRDGESNRDADYYAVICEVFGERIGDEVLGMNVRERIEWLRTLALTESLVERI